jgi:hypothetical protein
VFKQTLELFKQLCLGTPYQGVYVENVLNPRLAEYLRILAETQPDYYWSEETLCCSWLKRGIEGHCGCPSPLEYCHGFAVGSYHIDTPIGLKAFVGLLDKIYI